MTYVAIYPIAAAIPDAMTVLVRYGNGEAGLTGWGWIFWIATVAIAGSRA